MTETAPWRIFFILYNAKTKQGYWLYIQSFFEEDAARQPRKDTATVRLFIPKKNRVHTRFIRYARRCKSAILRQTRGARHYHG